jgi:hypothetical protein
VAGKTISQWDRDWTPIAGGFSVPHPELRQSVGLIRAVFRGQVMYIGQATEWKNGGLAKRLADFTRPSPSGREHYGARYIRDHLGQLELEVLITGSDKQAAQTAKVLRAHMLALHSPPKNLRGKRRPKVVPIRRSNAVHEGSPSQHQQEAA